MLVALGCFALQADEAPWKQTLGRVKDLSADTGVSGFLKSEPPAYITGNFDESDRPEKKPLSANRNGYYDKDGKWHGGYFDDQGAFHAFTGFLFDFDHLFFKPFSCCQITLYYNIKVAILPVLKRFFCIFSWATCKKVG